MEEGVVKIPGHEKRNSHFAQGVNYSEHTFAGVRPIHRYLQRKQLWKSGGGIRGTVNQRVDGHVGSAKMSDLSLVIPTGGGTCHGRDKRGEDKHPLLLVS
jgi:hypothetical protein